MSVNFHPAGEGAGNAYYSGNVVITGTPVSAQKDGFVLMRGRHVEIPEWQVAGRPVTVHFDPMTLHQLHQLQQRARGNEARGIALAVILFAKNADGARMFTDDAETLATPETRVDPAVLSRIAAEMMRSTSQADLGK